MDGPGAATTSNPVAVPIERPPGAAIRIAPDVHPDRATHVRLGSFDGPLALLLGLIEQRQLDILRVPLGDLAAAYLDALTLLGERQLQHISAFITVASQLILIKSRALLPRPPATAIPSDEGRDPEEELRRRLLEYRRYRDAALRLAARLSAGVSLFHREPAAASAAGQAGAQPPQEPPLDPELLSRAIHAALQVALPPPPPPEVIGRVITLEERAAVIRRALRRAPVVVLQDLLLGSRDRVVVAITFLALLEMVKMREVTIEQHEPWGPIECRRLADGTTTA